MEEEVAPQVVEMVGQQEVELGPQVGVAVPRLIVAAADLPEEAVALQVAQVEDPEEGCQQVEQVGPQE